MAMALSIDKRAYHSGSFRVWFEASLLSRLFHFRGFLGAEGGAAGI